MIDCILGYYLNPLTSGVAKFNLTLSQYLQVPMLSMFDPASRQYKSPLLSFKGSELQPDEIAALHTFLNTMDGKASIFFHNFSDMEIEWRLVRQCATVFCGNAELVEHLQTVRPDVRAAWCPGTLLDSDRFQESDITVFSFGMAHKVKVRQYERLRDLLEESGKSYCLYLSTALHDGTSFDTEFSEAYQDLQRIFGSHIYFMGYLSDTAVYNYLRDTSYYAAFFDRGVRANNTSVNIALQCGAAVITNLDQYSPTCLKHLENVIDIHQCQRLPTSTDAIAQLKQRAEQTASLLGWEALIKEHFSPR